MWMFSCSNIVNAKFIHPLIFLIAHSGAGEGPIYGLNAAKSEKQPIGHAFIFKFVMLAVGNINE